MERYATLAQLTMEERLTAQAHQPGAPRAEPGAARLPGADQACLLFWLAISLALITVAAILARANPGTGAGPAASACAVQLRRLAARHPALRLSAPDGF